MRIGFIGTGHIAKAVITGLSTIENPPTILCSPRNEQVSFSLSTEFKNVEVAKSNQAVINQAEIVVIALRPQVALPILENLIFPSSCQVISLMPLISVSQLQETIQVKQICRAIPLPSCAQQICPIPIYPLLDYAEEIFLKIGTPLSVDAEDHLHILWALTGLIAPYYEFVNKASQWAVEQGVSKEVSEQYNAEMFFSLSKIALNRPSGGFNEMAQSAATKGGLNEQANKELTEFGVYKELQTTLTRILKRFDS